MLRGRRIAAALSPRRCVRRFAELAKTGQVFLPSAAPPPSKLKPSFLRAKTFGELGVSQLVEDALKALKLSKPTPIQARTIPYLLQGKSAIIADQTGTGKTLSYLLPLIQRLKEYETKSGMAARAGAPRAIIVAPSRELATQILLVAKSLSHVVKFRSALMIGGQKKRVQKLTLASGRDILVVTPGRLRQLFESKSLRYDDLQTLVCDEADTLFESTCGFMEDLDNGLLLSTTACKSLQSVFVSATMPEAVRGRLQRRFGDLQMLQTPSLHAVVSSLSAKFIHVGKRDKLIELRDLLQAEAPKPASTIVFVNTIEAARSVHHHLTEASLSAASVHGDIPAEVRKKNFDTFKNGDACVLVATDIACRGLDLSSAVHVILFDFPKSCEEFLHRAGRTARAGRPGAVTALVNARERHLSDRIQKALEHGRPLEDAVHRRTHHHRRDPRNEGTPTRLSSSRMRRLARRR